MVASMINNKFCRQCEPSFGIPNLLRPHLVGVPDGRTPAVNAFRIVEGKASW